MINYIIEKNRNILIKVDTDTNQADTCVSAGSTERLYAITQDGTLKVNDSIIPVTVGDTLVCMSGIDNWADKEMFIIKDSALYDYLLRKIAKSEAARDGMTGAVGPVGTPGITSVGA